MQARYPAAKFSERIQALKTLQEITLRNSNFKIFTPKNGKAKFTFAVKPFYDKNNLTEKDFCFSKKIFRESLRKSGNIAGGVYIYMLRSGHLAQPGHKVYIACNGHDEPGSALIYDVAHINFKADGTCKFFCVIR